MINNRGNTAVRNPKDLEPIRSPLIMEYYMKQAEAKKTGQTTSNLESGMVKKFPGGKQCWSTLSCWEDTRLRCPVSLSCSKAFQHGQIEGLSLEEQIALHLKQALRSGAKAVLKRREIECLLSILEAKSP